MALINCPECGRENVSETAIACPCCGFNIKEYVLNTGNETINLALPQNDPEETVIVPTSQQEKEDVKANRFVKIAMIVSTVLLIIICICCSVGNKSVDVSPTENQPSLMWYPENSLAGHWEAVLIYMDGEAYTEPSLCDLCYASFQSDHSGYISIVDDRTYVDWEYVGESSDGVLFKLYYGGSETGEALYITDSNDPYDKCLFVPIDDETALFFERG